MGGGGGEVGSTALLHVASPEAFLPLASGPRASPRCRIAVHAFRPAGGPLPGSPLPPPGQGLPRFLWSSTPSVLLRAGVRGARRSARGAPGAREPRQRCPRPGWGSQWAETTGPVLGVLGPLESGGREQKKHGANLPDLLWSPPLPPVPSCPLLCLLPTLRPVLCFPQTRNSQGRCQPWGRAGRGQGRVAGASRGDRGGRACPAAPPAPRAVRMRAQAAAPAPSAWCPSPAPGPPESCRVGTP